MTSPQHPRSSGLDANGRGIAVLLAAVLIGLLLLWNAGGTSDAPQAQATTTTTIDTTGLGDGITSTPSVDETTSTSAPAGSEAREPSEVTVLVLNSGGPKGSAGTTTETIKSAGYQTAKPTDANDRTLAVSVVYFAPGYEAEATGVAALLGKRADVVAPLPSTSPGAGADAANVVVLLGQDTVVSGNTTTTVAN